AVGERTVELAAVVEEADALCALARLDDELDCAGVEPGPALLDQLVDDAVDERAAVFQAELELDLEPALVRHRDDLGRLELEVGEAVRALHARCADVGAEVEVPGQAPLRDRDLE